MNILINGIMGFMGREVYKLCESGYLGARFAAGVDPTVPINTELNYYRSIFEVEPYCFDCIIDFSRREGTLILLKYALEHKKPIVIATTGHTDDEINLIRKASEKIPVFYSANMSLGTAILAELVKKTVLAMPDAEIEIIEKHHNRKNDAPSGTARMLVDTILEVRADSYAKIGRCGSGKRAKEEIGVHAIRMGNIVGEHEVIIGTESQTVTLRHEALNRAIFAEGALTAAKFLLGCGTGLYDMKSLILKPSTEKELL